jgi:gliding motility-associated-like protein
MNRTTYLFFLKSILALFIVSFSNNVLAGVYTAISDGDFSSPSTWGGADATQASSGDFINIPAGRTVYITSNVNVRVLSILDGGKLIVNTTNTINITAESLTINSSSSSIASIVDFGTSNVTFTVIGNLVGGTLSTIKHTPNTGKTQQLILQGSSNSLYSYTYSGAGASIVTYSGTNQTVFNAGPYSNLELIGSGTKTLLAPSGTAGEATAQNKLTITNCKLQLGAQNFNYLGTESNLSYSSGWIYTDDTGTYSSNNSTNAVRTFPVGNATKMQALSLSNVPGTKISVRFGSPATAIPNSGLGAWYITTPTAISTKPTFITPTGTVSSTSTIVMYSGTAWNIQATTYNAGNYSATNNISIPNGTTAFGLFTCPTFTVTPVSTTLPDANIGDLYRDSIKFSGGTSPYTLSAPSASLTAISSFNPAGKILINFTPTTVQNISLLFTIQDATGCQAGPLTYTINAAILSTTWNGSVWSNGPPTQSIDAIIAGPYSTATSGDIIAKSLTIQASAIFTLADNGNLEVTGAITNSGTLKRACIASIKYTSYTGNTIVVDAPVISPANMPAGLVGQPYSQTFTVAGDPAATFTINNSTSNSPLPNDYTFNSTLPADNTLRFTQTTAKTLLFGINYTKGVCVVNQTQQIIIRDLPSPNLAILSIGAKTYGDAPFKARSYSRSDGTITYSIASGSCAAIDLNTGEITISCAGPSPQNIIVVKATQAASPSYKAESATETFIIRPAAGRFIVRNYAFLENQTSAINVFTRLDANPTLTFQQLTGFSSATVQSDGSLTTAQTGAFTVQISLAATNNYTAFDSTYTFNVITQQIPPVAVADTIVLEMGKDSTFNILDNDLGMTMEIAPNKTDIDIENSGIQTKFYATELGNFLIDPQGNLTILPFNGFIGSGRLGYTVSDVNGLQSEIAYVDIIVNPPYVVPELKVNTAMTPNGDHLNDALVIANTDLNKENSLIIIDQAGNTIYETTNYQNNWEGVDNKNNKIEAGVYFYIFKEKNSGRELKNYIQIVY